jgi:PAS domain S-box-containing protein
MPSSEVEMTLSVVVGTILLLILAGAFITSLVVSQRRKIELQRDALAQLAASEKKYRDLFTHAVEGIYQSTPDGRYLSINPALAHIYGYKSPEEMMEQITEIGRQLYVDPSRRTEFMKLLAQHGQVRNFEYEAKRKDGTRIWISGNARAVRDERGEIVYYEGTVQDITDRKRAEQLLLELPGNILQAQESERKRIARELHDGVNQLLSAANMELQTVVPSIPRGTKDVLQHLEQARLLLQRAISEVRRISHNLRPSELDDLGLIPALQSLCDEFRQRTMIQVTLVQPTVLPPLPDDVSLTTYRVVQEALTNTEKYARATTVTVEVSADDASLYVRVRDDGRGFDPSGVRTTRHGGFGLMGMVERVALVGGHATVESMQGRGTKVSVSIPLRQSAGGDSLEA